MKKRLIIYLLLPATVILITYHYSDADIHIIRHGEKVIKQGVSDAPLTENGKIQARNAGILLSLKTDISKLYASPMRRTRESAEIIASQTKTSILFDERLTEKNYSKSEDLYPDGNNIYVKCSPNGKKETNEQHLARLMNFLEENVKPLDKNVYIVGHGGLISRLFEKIAADNNEATQKYTKPYCSVFIFRYNKITKSLRYIESLNLAKQ